MVPDIIAFRLWHSRKIFSPFPVHCGPPTLLTTVNPARACQTLIPSHEASRETGPIQIDVHWFLRVSAHSLHGSLTFWQFNVVSVILCIALHPFADHTPVVRVTWSGCTSALCRNAFLLPNWQMNSTWSSRSQKVVFACSSATERGGIPAL